VDKNGPLQSEQWGPLPDGWRAPLSEKVQQEGEANQALLRLMLDTRYYLHGELQHGWVPSSREDFERARTEFHRRLDDALMGRGNPSYLHHLADQIAIFEERKNPPPLTRSERTENVIAECFVKLWTEGDNWVTRKEFFALVCAEFKAQECPLITYRHLVRILEDTGLVVPCKNKRYILKFLDESSGGQD
jgi:hypothetical protein